MTQNKKSADNYLTIKWENKIGIVQLTSILPEHIQVDIELVARDGWRFLCYVCLAT